MDRLREKINSYRDQAEQANARAEALEVQLRELQEQESKQERIIASLNDKYKTAEDSLDQAQLEIDRLKAAEGKEEEQRKETEAALRKISLLETELENSDKALHEATQNFREADVKAEHFERKVQQLENELANQEKKYDALKDKSDGLERQMEEFSAQLDQI